MRELSSIAFQRNFCLEKIISGRQRPGIQDVVRVFRTHLAKRMHRGLHQGTCGPMVLCGVLPLARRVRPVLKNTGGSLRRRGGSLSLRKREARGAPVTLGRADDLHHPWTVVPHPDPVEPKATVLPAAGGSRRLKTPRAEPPAGGDPGARVREPAIYPVCANFVR